jgi:hypothetical protein
LIGQRLTASISPWLKYFRLGSKFQRPNILAAYGEFYARRQPLKTDIFALLRRPRALQIIAAKRCAYAEDFCIFEWRRLRFCQRLFSSFKHTLTLTPACKGMKIMPTRPILMMSDEICLLLSAPDLTINFTAHAVLKQPAF